jgi:hypothetical protein
MESEVQQHIQIGAMHFDCTLMRNNSGALLDETGRPVRFGLGNVSKKHAENSKSSDLIGITTIIITPEMVGQKIGVFTAIEVKDENWNCQKKLDKHETAQFNFIQWVISKGGIAGFANSVDNLKQIFRR